MNLVWFYIIITIAVTGMLAMLFIEFPIRRRAKAGTADKYVFGCTAVRRLSKVTVGDRCVNAADYEQMVAAGDSMQDYNIHNGDSILVAPYDEQGKLHIDRFPVLAIKLRGPMKPFDSDIKLRKFVGYVSDQDWDAAYNRFHDRVKPTVSRDAFVASCAKSYSKHQFTLTDATPAVLSETYDVDSHCYHYSVHPVENVYGKVVFVGGKR